MTLVRRMPLRRFFLNTRILGLSPRLRRCNDARVGDVGGPGDDFAAVTFDEQDAVERQLRTGRSCVPSTSATAPGVTFT